MNKTGKIKILSNAAGAIETSLCMERTGVGGYYRAHYTEVSQGMEGSHTLIEVDLSDPHTPKMLMTRRGAVESEQSFILGTSTKGYYQVVSGNLAFDIETRRLRAKTDSRSLWIELEATFTFSQVEKIPFTAQIELTW